VRDTGDGIAPDLLPRVWDLFMQGDASDQRRRSGLGIGLTLVRSLVQMHGGEVEAHSNGVGKGSEVVVRLPVASGPAPPAEAALAPALAESPIPLSGRSILVVDDNRDAAESLALLLKLMGNEVQTAYDGPAALEAVARQRPQIVILDIGLPEMNGYEVARHLRQDVGRDNLLLVALSGYGTEEDRRRSHEAGFDAHLTKPTSIHELRQALTALE